MYLIWLLENAIVTLTDKTCANKRCELSLVSLGKTWSWDFCLKWSVGRVECARQACWAGCVHICVTNECVAEILPKTISLKATLESARLLYTHYSPQLLFRLLSIAYLQTVDNYYSNLIDLRGCKRGRPNSKIKYAYYTTICHIGSKLDDPSSYSHWDQGVHTDGVGYINSIVEYLHDLWSATPSSASNMNLWLGQINNTLLLYR